MTQIITLDQWKSKIDEEIGASDWIEVTQERINEFARASGDFQFIHVDPELAQKTPFGGTIAHGMLTLSLSVGEMIMGSLPMVEGTVMGVNYGFNKVRFIAPVHAGKRIRGRYRLSSVDDSKPSQVVSVLEVTVEIEGADKPACVADFISLFQLG